MSKRFLDEVVKQIVRETKIDSEKEEIHFQFLPLDEIYGTNTFHVPHFDLLTIYNSFFKHCRHVYGLEDYESDYVWGEYENNVKSMIDVFGGTIYLEESIHISDKDNKFLDEVVNQIVRETEVDYVTKRVKLHFTSNYTYLDIVDAYIFPYPPFEEHLEGVYGLKKMGERKYVQNNYEDTINNMLNPKGNINESTDMNKKFLNKVSDQLVRETMLDYSVGIFTPFREFPFQIKINDSRFFTSMTPPSSFNAHLRGVYGVYEWGELIYLWNKYVETLRDKIERNG